MNSAFEGAGRAPGLTIWRIEKFEPVPYPPNNYGKFHTGDSYIVLNTIQGKDKKFTWDVHYWLGAETTGDEAGAAAILTVQLDDLLGGAPVQHREVQDHESALFLSYFKNGVRYEQGGIGSGFKHAETNAAGEKRLFHVKGKRNVRVRQVYLSISSMNKGDSFILDAGNDIYVYNGANARIVEKAKAVSAANQIRDQDHNGRAKLHIVDDEAEKEEFFRVLGSGSPKDVPEASVAGDDVAFEVTDAASIKLFKISDEDGKLKITPIAAKPLRQELLDTRDCFVLDTGSGLYVWVGRGATETERKSSMTKAEEFLRTQKYPAWTQVHRIFEGGEPAPFKQYFATWIDRGMSHSRLIRSALGYGEDQEFNADEIDAINNLKRSGGKAITFMPDNGQQDIEELIQFSVKPDSSNVDRYVLKYEQNMPLIGYGSCVISYKYRSTESGQTGVIIYVWQGAKAPQSVNEHALEAGLRLANERRAILVRTKQGHEPRHFYKMFKGKLLASYSALPVKPQLFRVSGTDASDVHANEVPADSSTLASRDVYVLVRPEPELKIWIWIGEGSTKFEQEMAKERFRIYWPNVEQELIEEGAEPSEFWDCLGGEGSYDRSLVDSGAPLLEPRLFHCRLTAASRRVKTEEIVNFNQTDLDGDDIMLIDAGDAIYIWVGAGASALENAHIFHMAKAYITQEPTTRTIHSVNVIRILQYNEPEVFKRMFPTWNDEYWQSLPTYEDYKNGIHAGKKPIASNYI